MVPGSGVVPSIFLGTLAGAMPCRAIVIRPKSGVTAPRDRSIAGLEIASGQTSAQMESANSGVVAGFGTAENFWKNHPLGSGKPV